MNTGYTLIQTGNSDPVKDIYYYLLKWLSELTIVNFSYTIY